MKKVKFLSFLLPAVLVISLHSVANNVKDATTKAKFANTEQSQAVFVSHEAVAPDVSAVESPQVFTDQNVAVCTEQACQGVATTTNNDVVAGEANNSPDITTAIVVAKENTATAVNTAKNYPADDHPDAFNKEANTNITESTTGTTADISPNKRG